MKLRCHTIRFRSRHSSGAANRKLIVWMSAVVILVVCLFGLWVLVGYRSRSARSAWKNTAIERLAGLSFTNTEFSSELDTLRMHLRSPDRRQWTGENVMAMTNGEYLVYAARHGANNGFVDHLFLARGSDDRWYYSTYHFCNNMVGVMADEPPGSIAEFATRYAVRQFDGTSDVCLEHTWPGRK